MPDRPAAPIVGYVIAGALALMAPCVVPWPYWIAVFLLLAAAVALSESYRRSTTAAKRPGEAGSKSASKEDGIDV